MIETHMLWVYGQVSQLERLAMRSFVAMGYNLTMWTYNPDLQVPDGVLKGDANEILPENQIFKNRVGSYAGFSDLFRYAVLNTRGGMYADTDVIAVKPATGIAFRKLLVSECKLLDHKVMAGIKLVTGLSRYINWTKAINGNIIFNPVPEPNGLIAEALRRALAFPKDQILWPEIGPALLTELASSIPDHGFAIEDVSFANPFPYWKCPEVLLQPGIEIPEETAFIHCYNEVWRWKRTDKNSVFPSDSILGRLGRTL